MVVYFQESRSLQISGFLTRLIRPASGPLVARLLSNSSLIPIGNVTTIPSFSDHLAIKCTIPVMVPDDTIYHLRVKNFNKTNINKLNNFILRGLKQQIIPLKQNLAADDCEELALNINQLFDTAVNKYVPVSSSSGKRTLLSSTTRALQSESKKLHRILFQNKNFLNLHREKFIKTRN